MFRFSRAGSVNGFTLIEIMVVVVIISVLMGAVALSFPRDLKDLAGEQADRLQALVRLSLDEAVLQSRELALGFNEGGYQFYQQENNAWVPFTEGPFKPRHLPANLLGELYLDDISVRLEKPENTHPQVFILSSGEMTPFAYRFVIPGKQDNVLLRVGPVGDVKREIPET